jgi:hypothetical protein
MHSIRRLTGALPAVAAAVALCACGSSPPVSPAQGRAQTQTLQAVRAVASELQADELAKSTAIDLSYDKCGRGSTHVQDVAQLPLVAPGSSLAPATYNARMVSAVSAAGWELTVLPKPDVNDVLYAVARNGFTGRLMISDGPFALTSQLTVAGACYDAGSAAAGLLTADNTFPAPAHSSG